MTSEKNYIIYQQILQFYFDRYRIYFYLRPST